MSDLPVTVEGCVVPQDVEEYRHQDGTVCLLGSSAWPTIEWLAGRCSEADAAVPKAEAQAVLKRLEELERERGEYQECRKT